MTDWKMASIFDERDQNDDYWKALDRRVGRTAEKEVETMTKLNKKVNEKKLDRGYDIVRIWELQKVMNEDYVAVLSPAEEAKYKLWKADRDAMKLRE